MAGQQREEAELPRSQVDELAAAPELVGDEVELGIVGDAEDVRPVRARAGPAGKEVEPVDELIRRDRCRESLVEAVLQGGDTLPDRLWRGQVDDSEGGSAAPLLDGQARVLGAGRRNLHEGDPGPQLLEESSERHGIRRHEQAGGVVDAPLEARGVLGPDERDPGTTQRAGTRPLVEVARILRRGHAHERQHDPSTACSTSVNRRLGSARPYDPAVSSRDRVRGLLIAAEGLDASGKSRTLELLGRWLERRGRRVRFFAWRPSRSVARAARDARRRPALTPRVAALLGAAEALRRVDDDVRPALDRGEIVLADRYAWTAVAREIARGLDAAWAAGLYQLAPAPDVVLLHRHDPVAAFELSLGSRPNSVRAEAVGGAFEIFLAALGEAYEALVLGAAGGLPGPWPTQVVLLSAGDDAARRFAQARREVAALLDRDRASR